MVSQYIIYAGRSTLLLDRKGVSVTITRAMMIAIPLGYFVSIFLIIAGFMGGYDAISTRPDDITRASLLVHISAKSWPLIAGCAVLLLIQIAKQIELLRLEPAEASAPQSSPRKKKKPAPVEEEASTFIPEVPQAAPVSAPQPCAPPAAPVEPPPPATPQPPAPAPISPTSTKAPLYPNSPIPGGGRVPQAPPPMPPQADGIAGLPSGGKRAPRKGENQGLSFFKVD